MTNAARGDNQRRTRRFRTPLAKLGAFLFQKRSIGALAQEIITLSFCISLAYS